MKSHIPTIVLTGGACAGKTTGLVRIRERLANLGWHPIVVPEVATIVFQGAGRPNFADRQRALQYQRTIVSMQLHLEDSFRSLAKEPKTVLLCDRGALDSKAFLSQDEWHAVLNDMGLNEVLLRDRRYEAIIHMVTAADGAPEAYKLEGVRNETLEEAITQDRRLQHAYLGHGHLKIIDNRTGFSEKLLRVEQEICNILGLPEPLELERKFWLPKPPKQLPQPCVSSTIEQIYLTSTADERRIRKRMQDGSVVFTLGLKRFVSKGKRIEKEEFLQGSEFIALLDQRDPECRPVLKRRHCFIHNKRCFELDEYLGELAGLWTLEVEVEDLQAPICLPDWAKDAIEVTGQVEFSNHELARKPSVPAEILAAS